MKHAVSQKIVNVIVLSCLFLTVLSGLTWADNSSGNISTTEKFAWSENGGWINGRSPYGGIKVNSDHLAGFAWGENIGWIKLGSTNGGPYLNTSSTNWGVNMDINGNLSGFAWSETIGWINFHPIHTQVTFDLNTGSFSGFAWAENMGYINFRNLLPAYNMISPRLTIEDIRVEENIGIALFKVSLYPPTGTEVTVQYDTSDGSSSNPQLDYAMESDDYNKASGTAKIAAGYTSTTIGVTILNDDRRESLEYFTLTLFNPSGASLKRIKAVAAIADDEAHSIVLTANENGAISAKTATYSGSYEYTVINGLAIGTVVTPHYRTVICSIIPDPGYHIAKVNINGMASQIVTDDNGIMPHTFYSVREDQAIEAWFEPNYYTVTINTGDGHGTVDPGSLKNVPHGAIRELQFFPEEHYHVGQIIGCNIDVTPVWPAMSTPPLNLSVTENCILNVIFTKDTYTISASVSAGVGDITPVSNFVSYSVDGNLVRVKAEYGSKPVFKITPEGHHHLNDIRVDNVSKLNQTIEDPFNKKIRTYTFDSIQDNYQLTALFEGDDYTIIVQAGEGGIIEYQKALVGDPIALSAYDAIPVSYANYIKLSFTPDASFYIASIAVDGITQTRKNSLSDSYTFSSIASNHYIKVIFANRLVTLFNEDQWGNFVGTCVYKGVTGLQDAISDPNTQNGDIIAIDPGVYNGFDIQNYNQNITLLSLYGPATTIIDANKSRSGLKVINTGASKIILKGLTIQNGLADQGGGVYIKDASPTFENCWILNNEAVLSDYADKIATSGRGGGFYISDNSAPILNNVFIRGNTAGSYGGGLYLNSTVNVPIAIIKQSQISHNIAMKHGGGIYVDGDVSGNYASPQVNNSFIVNNEAKYDGGAVYINNAMITLYGNTITSNKIQYGYGGGIFHNGGRTISIKNCIVRQNGRDLDGKEYKMNVYYSNVGQTKGEIPVFENNINADSEFMDTSIGDYHLKNTSPCIEKGSSAPTDIHRQKDADNQPRFVLNAVDIGADEYQTTQPNAYFYANAPLSGYSPLTIQFTDSSTSTSSISYRLWDFGDGYYSTELNPTHIYRKTGTYTVSLTVRDPNGYSSTRVRYDYIQVNPTQGSVLTVDFIANPVGQPVTTGLDVFTIQGDAPLDIQFTDLSSSPKTITSWAWDFGDGGSSIIQSPIHAYTTPGIYTVKLTLTDESGHKSSRIRYAYISVSDKSHDVDFEYMPTICDANATPCSVMFYDTSITKDDIESWQWNFGDGSNPSYNTTRNPIHQYTSLSNPMTVTLTIISGGVSASTSKTIKVLNSSTYTVNTGQSIQDMIINGIDDDDLHVKLITIYVQDGIYNEYINFKGKPIIVKAINRYGATIDISGKGPITFNTGETRETILDGFVIKGGLGSYGGGIYITGSSPTIKNCKIIQNEATIAGGGIMIENNAAPFIFNCDIGVAGSPNKAKYGGGIASFYGSNPVIYNCRLAYNTASIHGAGIYHYSEGYLKLFHTTIDNNRADTNIYDTYSGMGGGIFTSLASLYAEYAFIKNNQSASGAGITFMNASNPTLRRCTIEGNQSGGVGGGLYIQNSSSPRVINSLIKDNRSMIGGAIYFDTVSSPIILFSSLVNNSASSSQSFGVYGKSIVPELTIQNSILWNTGGDEVTLMQSTSPKLSHSTFDQQGLTGTSILSSNPKFVSYGTLSSNYHLQVTSPCQNTGNVDQSVLWDLDGQSRQVGLSPDMGVYELRAWGLTVSYTGSGYVADQQNSHITSGKIVEVNHQDSHVFSIIPQTGYAVTSVKVDGLEVVTTPLTSPTNARSYTFTQVTSTHAINITFSRYTVPITIYYSGNVNTAGYQSEGMIGVNGEPQSLTQGILGSGSFIVNAYHSSVLTLNAIPTTSTSTFVKWNLGANNVNKYVMTVTQPTNLTAYFALNTYYVDVDITSGTGSGTVRIPTKQVQHKEPLPVIYGNSLVLYAEPDISSQFTGWTGSASSSNYTLTLSNVKSDKSLVAHFSLKPVKVKITQTGPTGTESTLNQLSGIRTTYLDEQISLTPEPKGSDVYEGITYQFNWGESLRLNATHSQAFSLSWTYSGSNCQAIGDELYCQSIQGDTDIMAKFSIDPIYITVRTDGQGIGKVYLGERAIANGEVLTVMYGQNLTLKAVPDANSSMFTGWSGHASGTGDAVLLNITDNKEIVATFKLKSFVIQASSGTGGRMSPIGAITVPHGATQKFTILPNSSGYYIAEVRIDNIPLTQTIAKGEDFAYTFTNITANHKIEAFFNRTILVAGGFSIQECIDISIDGDTIEVPPGRYEENINFKGKAIRLIAQDPLMTIIDGAQKGTVVQFKTGEGGDTIMNGFVIENGRATAGGGIYIENASPTIENCRIIFNEAEFNGGGIYMTANSSPLLMTCSINNNLAAGSGGGLYISDGTPYIFQTRIQNNKSQFNGGGIYSLNNASPLLVNTLITGNTASYNGGGLMMASSIHVYNTTISDNNAGQGSALYADQVNSPNQIRIYNSILWHHSTDVYRVVESYNSNGIQITYSNVKQSSSVYTGTGNMNKNPQFESWQNSNYRLNNGSPCINKGTTNPGGLLPVAPTWDIDNYPRPYYTFTDMGAYEWNDNALMADIYMSSIKGNAPLTVSFEAYGRSLNAIQTWDWNFGNMSVSNDQQPPDETYNTPGLYKVQLSVTDQDNKTIVIERLIEVRDKPTANFIANVTSGYAPLTIQFTDKTLSSQLITDRTWDFGDGSQESKTNPSHTYVKEGVYTVKLIVNNQDTAIKYNYITVMSKTPVPDFHGIPTSGVAPLSVQFYDKTYAYNANLSYVWSFGDGQSSAVASPSHVYASTGLFTVSFSVKEGQNNYRETKNDYIRVMASQPTKTVCHIGCDYATIQAAIDAAQAYDSILVRDGVYPENINFKGKSVYVKSEHTPYETFIDGQYLGSVVTFESGETHQSVLEGFTIKKGNAEYGGGIIVRNNSSPTIKNCIIETNDASKAGGGVAALYNSDPGLIDVRIINTNKAAYGAGFACLYNSNPMIINSEISGNQASVSGGGIYVYAMSSPYLENVSIQNNRANNMGGGIFVNQSASIIKQVTIKSNNAMYGAGVAVKSGISPLLERLTIQNNSLATYGGGVYMVDTRAPEIRNTIITGNQTVNGGGVYFENCSTPLVHFSTLANNLASGLSDGIHVGAYDINAKTILTVRNSILWNDGDELNILPQDNLVNMQYTDIADSDWLSLTGNFNQDPLFANTDTYRLGVGSPCKNIAIPESTPVYDIDGNKRPLGKTSAGVAAYDIGADEAINVAPIPDEIHVGVFEDRPGNITLTGKDEDGDILTFRIDTPPEMGTLSGVPPVLRYEPQTNLNGTDTFTFICNDGTFDSVAGQVIVTLTPVNDRPTFTLVKNTLTVSENCGPQTRLDWVTEISPGPFDEMYQDYDFIVSAVNNAFLFSGNIEISKDGTLTFTPAPNASGQALFEIRLKDKAGTLNSGYDTSLVKQFTLTIEDINDAPVFDIATGGEKVSVLEDSGIQIFDNWAINIGTGAASESTQQIWFEVQTNNDGLFSQKPAVQIMGSYTQVTGRLTFVPKTNVNGSATVTVYLKDDGGIANGGKDTSIPHQFIIEVIAVNDAPEFILGPNPEINEDSGPQAVPNWIDRMNIRPGPSDATDETSQRLTFILSTDNPALFAGAPLLSANGTLTYAPATNAFGKAIVSVQLTDNGGTTNNGKNASVIKQFEIKVNPVNDAPTYVAGPDLIIQEDSGSYNQVWATQINPGIYETDQTASFYVTVNTDSRTIFSVQPRLSPEGYLSFVLANNAYGNAILSIYLEDTGGTERGGKNQSPKRTLTIQVTELNDAPTFDMQQKQTVLEDCELQSVVNWATNISAGAINENNQTLTFDVSTPQSILFEQLPSITPNGTLVFKPKTNSNGIANVTVYLRDNGTTNGLADPKQSATKNFDIEITAVNDQPVFIKGANQTIREGAAKQEIINWATGIQAGPENESTQTLSFIASTNNDLLFDQLPEITTDGKLTYQTKPDAYGTATVSVYLKDSGGTGNKGKNLSETAKFTITVDPVNDAPKFTIGPDIAVDESAPQQIFKNWATNISPGADNEKDQTLTFHLAVDGGNDLFIEAPEVFADGTLKFKPKPYVYGVRTISIYLEDNGGRTNGGMDISTTQRFTIEVISVNDPPTFTLTSTLVTVQEDEGEKRLSNFASQISSGPLESAQNLTFQVTAKNIALFSIQPSITPEGELRFTPATNAFGQSLVSVILNDSGLINNLSTVQEFTIQVVEVNDPPTYAKGVDISVKEDSGPQRFPGWATQISKGATNESTQTIAFQLETRETQLFAVLPSIDQDGMLTFTPAKDQAGSTTVLVRLKDDGGVANGGSDSSAQETFTIQIREVNDAPTFSLLTNRLYKDEDSGAQVEFNWVRQISSGPNENQSLEFIITSNNTSLFSVEPKLSITGMLTFTLAPDMYGSATVRVLLKDSGGTSDGGENMSVPQEFMIVVNGINDAPNFDVGPDVIIKEDSGFQSKNNWASNITKGADNEYLDTLIFTITSDNSLMFKRQTEILQDGTLRFEPEANANGIAVLRAWVEDQSDVTGFVSKKSAEKQFRIHIISVNDAPFFVPGADQTILEDSGLHIVTDWGTQITSGANNETGQTIWFDISTDNETLFERLPEVTPEGDLSYQPALNMSGTATVSIIMRDNGGQVNGGSDIYIPNSKTIITVVNVNDAPSFIVGQDQHVPEGSGLQTISNWATNIKKGPPDESDQQVLFHTQVDKPSLFERAPTVTSDGVLSFKPAPDASGVATVLVWIEDSGGTQNNGVNMSAPQTFSITIEGKNDPPSFTKGDDQITLEGSDPVIVENWATHISAGGPGEEDQELVFYLTAEYELLFEELPEVTSDGTLTYKPNPDANGETNVTIYLEDNGDGNSQSTAQVFKITILPVNDAPEFIKGPNLIVLEDATPQVIPNWATNIRVGPIDEEINEGQTASFLITTNDPSMFATGPSISPDGKLTFTPSLNRKGIATVTAYLQDTGGVENGGKDTSLPAEFTITIIGINDAPSFVKGPDLTVKEDGGKQTLSNWATNIKAGPPDEIAQTLSFHVNTDQNTLFSEIPSIQPNGTITYTPAKDAFGVVTVSIFLEDDGGTANGGNNASRTETFKITILSVNDPPFFTPGEDQQVHENEGAKIITSWAKNINPGANNESTQKLSFQLEISNTALFAKQPEISASGALSFEPEQNISGSAIITVYLLDDGGVDYGGDYMSDAHQFRIDIVAINDAPTFTVGPNQIISEDAGEQIIYQWAKDISAGPHEENQTIEFVTTTEKPDLFIKNPEVQPDGTLQYIIKPNVFGQTWVDVYLKDNGGTNPGVDTSTIYRFTITIQSVNDAPTFLSGVNQTILEDMGNVEVAGWASNILAGPTNESGQTIHFVITTDNDPLFEILPRVDANTGTLTYKTREDASGKATVRIKLEDDGGTDNGGANQSVEKVFTITVIEINDPPEFTLGSDQMLLEDSGDQYIENWAKNINPGSPNEVGQRLTFRLNADNTALFSIQPTVDSNGQLIFTPANDAFGSTKLTIYLEDNGGTENGGDNTSEMVQFSITILPVNDPPSFMAGSNVTVLKNSLINSIPNWARLIKAGPTNEAAQSMIFNTSVLGDNIFSIQPNISLNGTLTFTLKSGGIGQAQVNVYLEDDGGVLNGGVNKSDTYTFTISVIDVNAAPYFTKGPDQSVPEDSGQKIATNWATNISAGSPDEIGQSIEFIVSNDKPILFDEVPRISPDGTLKFTPAANAFGIVNVTVYLRDDGGTVNGGQNTSTLQQFKIDIKSVNDPPSFTMNPIHVVNEDSGKQAIANWTHNVSPGPENEITQSIEYLVRTDNASLFSLAPSISAQGLLVYTPAPNANGEASVYVRIKDNGRTDNGGQDISSEQLFTITINPKNDPPVNTVAPSISGVALPGNILTGHPGVWNDDIDYAPGNLTFKYQWQIATSPYGTDVINISGETSNQLQLTTLDKGKYIRVKVTAYDDGEGSTSENQSAFSIYVGIGMLQADIDGDGEIGLSDSIIMMQMLSGMTASPNVNIGMDVNGDSRLGLEEMIYIMMHMSEML